ncbi:hypothetical protein FRB90_003885 [Tulasnella sp. 427]|nr:hypothetical protein FRB90_003885 [Tulasnella sp. 427]
MADSAALAATTGYGKQAAPARLTTHAFRVKHLMRLYNILAQIPMINPIQTYVKGMVEHIQTFIANERETRELLERIQALLTILNDFLTSLELIDIKKSSSLQARIARHVIERFSDEIHIVGDSLLEEGELNQFLAFVAGSSRRDILLGCSSRLEALFDELQVHLLNIHTADKAIFRDPEVTITPEIALSSLEREAADLYVVGAEIVEHSDVRIIQPLNHSPSFLVGRPSFWEDTQIVQVGGKRRLAKLYYKRTGGSTKFVEHLDFLGQNVRPNLPPVQAYYARTNVPFVLFNHEILVPFDTYCKNESIYRPETALVRVWKLLIDIRDAAHFLLTNNPDLLWFFVQNSIRDAAIDENGKAVLAPLKVPGWDDFTTTDETASGFIFWCWSAFLQRDPYYRYLGMALYPENLDTLLDRQNIPLECPEKAAGILRSWRLPDDHVYRHVPWPLACERPVGLLPGTVGFFEERPGRDPRFHPLNDARDVLGPYKFEIEEEESEGWTEVAPSIYRTFFRPVSQHGDNDPKEVETPEIALLWAMYHENTQKSYSYMAENAERLAEQYGIRPEDLVLVIGATAYISSPMFADIPELLETPLYFYVHMDKREGFPKYLYWSLDDSPLNDPARGPFPDVGSLRDKLPREDEFIISPSIPDAYLQLDARDLEDYRAKGASGTKAAN